MTLYFIHRKSLFVAFMRSGIKIAGMIFQCLKVFLLLFFCSQQLNAEVLIRMEVQQGVAISNVYLKLFDRKVGYTVENFLKYVNGTTINGGSYNNSFIHRSIANSIVQGGGFTFDPAVNDGMFSYNKINNTYPGGLQNVPVDPPIVNQFKMSNLRGTIAMAKISGDPNSATSQWFINLADNSSILDGQNGGFTVFGEVISDGMTVIDDISNQTTFSRTDIHPAFGDLPLINYVADPVQQENLVRINSINELFSISTNIDFGPVLLNTSKQSDITIKNTDNASHSIGDISTIDTINVPFSIIADTCSNTTLAQGAECLLTIQFSPQSENVFNDTFNIELTDLTLSYSFSQSGEGVLTPPFSDITPSLTTVEFGDAQLFNPLNGLKEQIVLFINNDGNLNLNITSVTLGGADVVDFEITDNCTLASPIIPAGFCVLPINFKPLTAGEKSATLTLISDDPDESTLIIPITGTASVDTDGVSVVIEDAAPNGGDGNNDGVMDSIQNNVASLPGTNGSYISLLTLSGTRISKISVLSVNQVVTPPNNVRFNAGVLDFQLDNVQVGGRVEVGMILPSGNAPTTYYLYGPTPDNTNPHWYEFLFDGITGAQLIGKANITSPNGKSIERNLIKLIFKDGERGDADLSANGTIVNLGGPVVPPGGTNSTDSGSLNAWLLLYLSGIVVLFRLIHHRRPCWNYQSHVKL